MKGRKPRPIRRHIVKPLSILREPQRESLIPGLRKEPLPDAIGFHHHIVADDEDE